MSKKPKSKEVECVHWSVNVQAYNVNIDEGKFVVVDYDQDDREIFWANDTKRIASHASEYKAAEEAIGNYLENR